MNRHIISVISALGGDYYGILSKMVRPMLGDGDTLLLGTHPAIDIQSIGIESPYVIEYVDSFFQEYSKAYPGRVYNQRWEGFSVGRKFDNALALDCIEHSLMPYNILDALASASDNIIISVPNSNFKMLDFHGELDHGHGPHVSYLSERDFREFFEQRGFKVEVCGIREILGVKVGLIIHAKR